MASCTHIESLLQAFVDGELGDSDRVILEQHFAECTACGRLLRKQQQISATLFEHYGKARLQHSLRSSVMENLPEIEPISTDLEGLNWRAKHPSGFWARFARLTPAMVAIVLIVVAFVLQHNWPAQPPTLAAIGIVMESQGTSLRIAGESTTRTPAGVKSFIVPGERYETGAGSTLMLGLSGSTQIKLNENARVHVTDERRISVENGQTWLEVGRDGRLFRVATPDGQVTVFGTRFAVKVESGKTTVSVEQGDVQVENDASFRLLKSGDQITLNSGSQLGEPHPVDIAKELAWAGRIVPDHEAGELLQKTLDARGGETELAANEAFVVAIPPNDSTWAVNAVRFYWSPDKASAGHCGYDVYVYDGSMLSLFKGRIPGDVFSDKRRTSFEIAVPGKPITGARVLNIRLVPDFSTGTLETSFSVKVRVGKEDFSTKAERTGSRNMQR